MEVMILPGEDGRMVKYIIRGRLGLSHRDFMRLKYHGRICLDGAPVFANAVARAGQRLTLEWPEMPASAPPTPVQLDIVYEDDQLMIINKPAPLPCQRSPRQKTETLENRVAAYLPDRPFRPVNRLDKGTSGLMACAKSANAQMLLSRQLHKSGFEREYLAVTKGAPPETRGVIDAPIGKADGATIKREVRADGKPAVTHYEVVKAQNGLALVRLRLETGRTHQIRVHLSSIGCPVLGDFLYGTELEDVLPGRFALHSSRIALAQPVTGERLCFVSDLPGALNLIT